MTDLQRLDWVQITEPRSREYMYINLVTGECVWEIPSNISLRCIWQLDLRKGVFEMDETGAITYCYVASSLKNGCEEDMAVFCRFSADKKSDDTEWWELFDANSARFYYYNAKQQKTVWHRPDDCDIIPLAKLQTLKQRSSDSRNGNQLDIVRKEISTQTVVPPCNMVSKISNSEAQKDSVFDFVSAMQLNEANKINARSDGRSSETESFCSRNEANELCKDAVPKFQTTEKIKPQVAVKPRIDRSSRSPNVSESVESDDSNLLAARLKPNSFDQTDSSVSTAANGNIKKHKDAENKLTDDSPRATRTVSRHSSDVQWPTNAEFTANFNSISGTKHCFPSPNMHVNRSDVQQPSLARCSFPGYAQETSTRQSAEASSAAHVATFQITPTFRPRVFPRTNPAYIGTYRRDRMTSLYKCSEAQQPGGVGLGNFEQAWKPLYELGGGTGSGGNGGTGVVTTNGGGRRPISDGAISVQRVLNHSSGGGGGGGGEALWLSASAQQASSQAGSDGSCRPVGGHRPHSDGVVVPRYASTGMTSSEQIKTRNNNNTAAGARDVHGLHGEDVSGQHTRRKSEPDYVNVSRNANRHSKTSMSSYTDVPHTDSASSSCQGGRISPTAIYVNQQDLALAAFSSRSACSFLEPITDGLPEFDFDDSDRSSVYSTPSPQSRHFQTLAPSSVGALSRTQASLSSYHPSLRKKKWFNRQTSGIVLTGMAGPVLTASSKQAALEKSWSLQAEMVYQRPMSLMAPYSSEMNVIANKVAGTLIQQMHIEQFVVENLNEHRKGLLGKTVSVAHMLSWTKDLIQKPMIRTSNKIVKKDAPELFRMIQTYMGDRKVTKETPIQLALDVTVRGWSIVDMRDEIYIQLCRQTTRNPREESCALGWELIGVCLAFFPPSAKFYSYLDGHINKNIESYSHVCKSLVYQYSVSCQKRLQWIVQVGAKRGLRKPNVEEVQQAKKSLIDPSMFGNSLEEIMHMQRDRYPERRLPWIQTTLSEEILRLGGKQTEGIFRIPGDIDEVNALKVRCDRWIPPSSTYSTMPGPAGNFGLRDPHVPASLLKLWYRELAEPLIPMAFYDLCLDAFMRPDDACSVVNRLPDINRLTLKYLIRFLQGFVRPDVVHITKMDVNNIAMVWAPNCLRGLSNDPKVIFDNTRREMGFVRTLIQSLDTIEAEDLL